MRVLVLVKATADSEKGFVPSPEMKQLVEAMDRYNNELIAAGITKPGDFDGLTPSSDGKRVRFNGAERTVIDGPFGPPEDLVAGYWIWEVKDMDEAVAWLKRCPNPMPGTSDIELRPIATLPEF